MTRVSRQKLLELYRDLPKDILEVYEGANTGEIVVDIGRKHGLLIDAVGRLSYEIGLVLVGAAPAHDFIDNVRAALGVPREKAVEIARDVNARIFSSIRESLKQLHGVPVTKELIQENAIEIPAPIAKAAAATPLAQPRKPQTAPSAISTPPPIPKPQTAPAAAVPTASKPLTAPSSAVSPQAPKPQTPPSPTVSKPPIAPSPAEPTTRVTVTPSAPGTPVAQPKPVTASYPAAPAGTASGQTYWRVLDTAIKDASPRQPAVPAPPGMESASDPRVNHEIEENKKGLLARIEQKEEERALGVRINHPTFMREIEPRGKDLKPIPSLAANSRTEPGPGVKPQDTATDGSGIKPAPDQPPGSILKNMLENEVGSILGSGAPVKPVVKFAEPAKEIKPAAPMERDGQARPAPPPVPPPNLPTTPASPTPKPPAAPQDTKTMPATPPAAPKNNLGMPPREPGIDPYREPIE